MDAAFSAVVYERQSGGWIRRLELQRPVRSVPVVVLDVDSQDLFQVPATHDEQPVQALGPHRPDPALGVGVGVGRLHWRKHHLGALRPKHVVEPAAELRVTIANKEMDPASSFLQDKQQVAGLLSDLGGVGVGGHSSHVNAPSIQFDEEQYVQPPQPDGVDGEEVTGEDPGGLLA